MPKIGPYIPPEVWRDALNLHKVNPANIKEDLQFRKIIINVFRKSFINYINHMHEEKGDGIRLVINDRKRHKISLTYLDKKPTKTELKEKFGFGK